MSKTCIRSHIHGATAGGVINIGEIQLQKNNNSKLVFVTYLLIGIIGLGLGFISCLIWITYLSGELNWDSISILSNIVLVFALVMVTRICLAASCPKTNSHYTIQSFFISIRQLLIVI